MSPHPHKQYTMQLEPSIRNFETSVCVDTDDFLPHDHYHSSKHLVSRSDNIIRLLSVTSPGYSQPFRDRTPAVRRQPHRKKRTSLTGKKSVASPTSNRNTQIYQKIREIEREAPQTNNTTQHPRHRSGSRTTTTTCRTRVNGSTIFSPNPIQHTWRLNQPESPLPESTCFHSSTGW